MVLTTLAALLPHLTAADVEAVCLRHVVDVSEVLASPRKAQPHDVAAARRELWLALAAALSDTQIARLWKCHRSTVAAALLRAARKQQAPDNIVESAWKWGHDLGPTRLVLLVESDVDGLERDAVPSPGHFGVVIVASGEVGVAEHPVPAAKLDD